MSSIYLLRLLCLAVLVGGAATAHAAEPQAKCGGDFQSWLTGFKQDATASGVSANSLAALDGITADQNVLSRDRGQHVFQQSFEEFSGRMVPPRLPRAENMMKRYGSMLVRIEKAYGVPGSVLVAIWGLETDFGSNIGSFPTLRSIVTLAYDCRRAATFRAELIDALKIIDHGDLAASEMRGAWAGELGQTQLMPSAYIKYAVDFDGNGKRDLLHSPADVLASTANYLASNGWKPGQRWDKGSANFTVLQQWNRSDVYTRTVASFADRLEGEH
jgi:lytic murein transglycosylase